MRSEAPCQIGMTQLTYVCYVNMCARKSLPLTNVIRIVYMSTLFDLGSLHVTQYLTVEPGQKTLTPISLIHRSRFLASGQLWPGSKKFDPCRYLPLADVRNQPFTLGHGPSKWGHVKFSSTPQAPEARLMIVQCPQYLY